MKKLLTILSIMAIAFLSSCTGSTSNVSKVTTDSLRLDSLKKDSIVSVVIRRDTIKAGFKKSKDTVKVSK